MDEKVITVENLQEKLRKHEDVFILDVRPAEQRMEWRIAESQHVDAYKGLNAGDYSILDHVQIPPATPVVTVCAAGRTSMIASKVLQERGIHALSLLGGMKAWNYAWNTAEVTFKNAKVIQIRRVAKGVLSYIIGSGSEAVVIDAALDPDIYKTLAEQNGWTLKYVTDTHIHADYVSRTRELARSTGAKHLLISKAVVDFEVLPVVPNEKISFGGSAIQFLHTPGHTWESTTFLLDDVALFTGDTLFVDGVGRPDLKADQTEAVEKAKALYRSLLKILSFSADMMVLPAHTSNPISFNDKLIGNTIQHIKGYTLANRDTQQEFVQHALSRISPAPPNYLTIAGINKTGSFDREGLADLEAGGNHCAIA